MNEVSSHIISSVDNCKLIDLQVFPNENGKLAVIENGKWCPFDIKRMFFLYDVPSEAVRGGHSHFEMEELIIAATGSFDVRLNDGIKERVVKMSRPNKALHVTSGIWRELDNFTSGAVCIVLASTNFDENDYVRNFENFKKLTAAKNEF